MFNDFYEYAAITGIQLVTLPVPEEQSSDYQSGSLHINGETWHIRTARNTPTKTGAFVAFWRRDSCGATTPFTIEDIDGGLMVFVKDRTNRGIFRFRPQTLIDLGIVAGENVGKRGFRVYPPWCQNLNRQARHSQRLQATAFNEY